MVAVCASGHAQTASGLMQTLPIIFSTFCVTSMMGSREWAGGGAVTLSREMILVFMVRLFTC